MPDHQSSDDRPGDRRGQSHVSLLRRGAAAFPTSKYLPQNFLTSKEGCFEKKKTLAVFVQRRVSPTFLVIFARALSLSPFSLFKKKQKYVVTSGRRW